ncbi:putative TIGR02611 family protein [Brevibacterium mcbrellneri ATCC 49030]|uniref:Putative TIGR02611 family protein n=1 Tax=Brevibacterium mcbrellneri ATCC 49030 TaxID=585530 RepID=D4YP93_9MICO|nr:putative TIGR02611 family protein [Brevibacterium mcbrellneri ATCC 49030]
MGIVGGIVIVVGLVLVPLPGPGWLIVLFGVAIIASEFHWAHCLLMWARKKLHAWTVFIKRSHWSVGAAIGLVTFLCVTFAVLCVLWFSGFDITRFF